jgi:MFS family permease
VRIDWAGGSLLALGTIAVLLAVNRAHEWGWLSTATLGLAAAGIAAAAALARHESRHEQPLVDLRMLRRRAVAATDVFAWLVGFAMFSSFVIMPQLAQTPISTGYGMGLSALDAGLLLTPCALMMLAAGPMTASLGTRRGFRTVMVYGALGTGLACAWMTFNHTEPWHFAVAGAAIGLGLGSAYAAMVNVILDVVPRSQAGAASGINTISRMIGGAFGATAATAALTSGVAASAPPHESGYTSAFALAAVSSLLAWSLALLVPKRPPAATAPAPF